MKTAREIIIDALMETHYDASDNTRATNIANRLAAEGFSIVETGHDPVTDLAFHIGQLRHAYTHLKANRVSDQPGLADGLISPAIAAFERSTREGKTE